MSKADLNQIAEKRSIKVGPRKTSITLEESFWGAVKEIAARESVGLGELVGRIDRSREGSNLSSAVRVFILNYYKGLGRQQMPAHQTASRPQGTTAGAAD